MTASTQPREGRRIVVVFVGGSSDTCLVRVLRHLVSKAGADISGVFLEDQTLFRLAGLPCAAEVSWVTMAVRPLAVRDLERQLKVQAKRAERQLRSLAESLGLAWSFRIYRGPLSSAITDVSHVDFLVLGAARHGLAGELRAVAHHPWRAEAERPRPVAVLLDAVDGGYHALDAAIELADATGRPLLVFVAQEVAQAYRDLGSHLGSYGPNRAAVQKVRGSARAELATTIRRASPAVLIANAGENGLEEPNMIALRRQIRCPVVLVRSRKPSL